MKIPKIIHFIWAGGTKLLPVNETNAIKEWSNHVSSDPDFKIFLWVDEQTTPKVALYKDSDEDYFAEQANIEIHDIKPFRENYIAYELDRLRPNYGASSDMLRYKILYKHGGAYFDSDIYPGTQSILAIFAQDYSDQEAFLFTSGNSQNRGLSTKTLVVGNDSFITMPKNEVFFRFYEECILRYQQEFRKKQGNAEVIDTDKVDSYDTLSYIKSNTLEKTGSQVMKYVFSVLKKEQLAYSGFSEHDKAIALTQISNFKDKTDFPPAVKFLPDPYLSFKKIISKNEKIKFHATQWAEIPIRVFIEPDELIANLKETIHFEAEHMHILRLMNHLSNARVSLNLSGKQLLKFDALFELLKTFSNNQQIHYIQKISSFKEADFVFSKEEALEIPDFFQQLSAKILELGLLRSQETKEEEIDFDEEFDNESTQSSTARMIQLLSNTPLSEMSEKDLDEAFEDELPAPLTQIQITVSNTCSYTDNQQMDNQDTLPKPF